MKNIYYALRRCIPAAAMLMLTSGCVHDMYYMPAKDKDYSVAPSLNDKKMDLWPETGEESPARYTSSARVAKERYRDPRVLGNLHVKQSNSPEKESMVFTIRKERRAYMAETPVSSGFAAGKKRIKPHFAIGRHKDHDIMAGLRLRMNF